jgi:hypothetical protein
MISTFTLIAFNNHVDFPSDHAGATRGRRTDRWGQENSTRQAARPSARHRPWPRKRGGLPSMFAPLSFIPLGEAVSAAERAACALPDARPVSVAFAYVVGFTRLGEALLVGASRCQRFCTPRQPANCPVRRGTSSRPGNTAIESPRDTRSRCGVGFDRAGSSECTRFQSLLDGHGHQRPDRVHGAGALVRVATADTPRKRRGVCPHC